MFTVPHDSLFPMKDAWKSRPLILFSSAVFVLDVDQFLSRWSLEKLGMETCILSITVDKANGYSASGWRELQLCCTLFLVLDFQTSSWSDNNWLLFVSLWWERRCTTRDRCLVVCSQREHRPTAQMYRKGKRERPSACPSRCAALCPGWRCLEYQSWVDGVAPVRGDPTGVPGGGRGSRRCVGGGGAATGSVSACFQATQQLFRHCLHTYNGLPSPSVIATNSSRLRCPGGSFLNTVTLNNAEDGLGAVSD